MFLKAFRLLLSSLLIAVVVYSFPSKALSRTESTTEKYLLDHGHSPEVVRMINLQKERAEGNTPVPSKSECKIKKFIKNIWFEQDATLPLTDFGYNDIKTVETNKSVIPPAVESVKSKLIDKDKDSKVININDIKIRD